MNRKFKFEKIQEVTFGNVKKSVVNITKQNKSCLSLADASRLIDSLEGQTNSGTKYIIKAKGNSHKNWMTLKGYNDDAILLDAENYLNGRKKADTMFESKFTEFQITIIKE